MGRDPRTTALRKAERSACGGCLRKEEGPVWEDSTETVLSQATPTRERYRRVVNEACAVIRTGSILMGMGALVS